MYMFLALLISISTLLIGVFFHLANITWIADKIKSQSDNLYIKTPAVVTVAIVSQILIAGLFTFSYVLAMKLGIGGFAQPSTAVDIFYFSLTTITTLGLGSVEPTGDLRMLAGIESATGFLLISCSAQKVFRTINE